MSWLLERADFCSALIVRRLVALGSYSTRFPVGSARKVAHLDHHRGLRTFAHTFGHYPF